MNIHPRVYVVNQANIEFCDVWLRQVVSCIDTLSVCHLILNQIDRFWIDSAINELSPKDACIAWNGLEFSSFAFSYNTQKAGSEFARIVEKYDLTYGEINFVLVSNRQVDVKSQIRNERHPDNPGYPGGLE